VLQFGFRPGGPTQPLPGSKAPVTMHLQPPKARRADTTSAGVEGPGSHPPPTAAGPEGRHNLDLMADQNQATLGCVSPSGLAIHRGLQPVVTTTASSDCSLCNWDSLEHRLASRRALPLAFPLER